MTALRQPVAILACCLAAFIASAGSAEQTSPIAAERYMVAAANPHAAAAGANILAQGGGAVDAAVAVQAVLGLVEPQSSGIGGGAFMVRYDAGSSAIVTYDGRETAPAAATPELFLAADGEPMKFWDAVVGGRSVGVPGTLRMLELAHRRHGKLPWAALFAPAIGLAETGFAVSPRLNRMIASDDHVKRYPVSRGYFYTDTGDPLPVGHVLKNPDYAATLRAVARDGADAFYRGAIARDIVAAVREAADNPGLLSEADLASYEAKARPPVCIDYRRHRVCGMGPPSSGGLTVGMILGLLEGFDLSSMAPNSLQAEHLFIEAARLAYADRALYMADDGFVPVPVAGLLDRGYLRSRSALIDSIRTMGEAEAGQPPEKRTELNGPDSAIELPSTSHFSIVDAEGNAVSMTASVESAFGARLMVRGFLLNNQLTDFSFRPVTGGRPVANRVQPGKRPRSSMAPTIVLDADGKLVVAVGSPGGSRIINYVARAVIGVLDWDLDIQSAVSLPHVVSRNGTVELEAGTPAEALKAGLEARGHTVRVRDLTSGLHGIVVTGNGLSGGADPRREGVAIGR